MTMHSDSNLGAALAFVAILGTAVIALVACELFASRKFRRAAKALLAGVALIGIYTLAVVAVSLLSPQRVVNRGDSYCADLWCIGIDGVDRKPLGQANVYEVAVHIFSDANHVATGARGASLYLLDERGRRFPLVKDPAATPFDMILEPGQSMHTSLTFVTAADARRLFLTGDYKGTPCWTKLYFGADNSLWHKRTLLRVL
jgi:hypothetical protein